MLFRSGKFGDVLAKTKKKLEEASATIDSAEVRTRAMVRQLRAVEAMPAAAAAATAGLLGTQAALDEALDPPFGEPATGGAPNA